jgi:hypothetical protein
LEAGNNYSIEREYTDDEKRQVTLEELVRWLNLRTFGVPNPAGPDDESIQPLLVHANTLAFWKKAISFYMPDQLHGWRSGSNDGNPTKSAEVNDFVKRIKKMEARKRGETRNLGDPCLNWNSDILMRFLGHQHNATITAAPLEFGNTGCLF